VQTLELVGIPDVRSTSATDCNDGVCRVPDSGANEEEKKE